MSWETFVVYGIVGLAFGLLCGMWFRGRKKECKLDCVVGAKRATKRSV